MSLARRIKRQKIREFEKVKHKFTEKEPEKIRTMSIITKYLRYLIILLKYLFLIAAICICLYGFTSCSTKYDRGDKAVLAIDSTKCTVTDVVYNYLKLEAPTYRIRYKDVTGTLHTEEVHEIELTK